MILVLTYHKVLREKESQAEFYSIRADQLERQLALLHQTGFSMLSPAQLLDSTEQFERACLLTFDDGTSDHWEVVQPLLARWNCKAVFFVLTAKLNRTGYLTEEQTRQLSQAGHTIGSHSHEHSRLDRLSEEDIRVQIEISHHKLASIVGSPPSFFAPPGGFISPMIQRVAIELGTRIIRTMRWGYNKRRDRTALECIPLNRYSTESEFRRVLDCRNVRVAYAAKQIAKKVVPDRLYESLRTAAFHALGRGKS